MGGGLDIVASNSFIQERGEEARTSFEEMEPLEAKNVGRIRGWKISNHPQRRATGRTSDSRSHTKTTRQRGGFANGLSPIAKYDAITFQKAFAELRQRNQKPAEVSP